MDLLPSGCLCFAPNLGKRFEVFGAGENLLNRQIEVGKTPTTTLSMPRVGRAGVADPGLEKPGRIKTLSASAGERESAAV